MSGDLVKNGRKVNGGWLGFRGKFVDYMFVFYFNEEVVCVGNVGVFFFDFFLIIKVWYGGVDYVYFLFIGYCDFFVGVKVVEGMNYNFYFFGGGIVMVWVLFDGFVEYDDGIFVIIF